MNTRKGILIIAVALVTTSFTLLSNVVEAKSYLYGIFIMISGGNGTSDGAQANADYEFTAVYPNNCNLKEFYVTSPSSTGLYIVNGNKITLWWKPSYVGTTQQIVASCECYDPFANDWVEYETVESYSIHN